MTGRQASLEDVIIALAKECDGAVRRDNRGYSRSDALEGARLAAMISSGILLSRLDIEKAKELGARHAMQAADLVGSTENAKRTLTDLLKKRKLDLRCSEASEKEFNSDMALRSTGGRYVDLWMQRWRDDHSILVRDIKRLGLLNHGERREKPRFKKNSKIHIHGKEKAISRWRLPYNGSTLPDILQIIEKYDFVRDIGIENGPPKVIDALRKRARACWIGGTKEKPVAIFDLSQKNPLFSERIKRDFRGKFSCSSADDWNWHIEWSKETKGNITKVIYEFNFTCEPIMLSPSK